ncbi:MAG: long-chain fatty acid--CoA ligase [Planctomycetaceae bacterium]|nr:long-chain fatty acid--CoA ligase [Planctomycetaceae bacterium]
MGLNIASSLANSAKRFANQLAIVSDDRAFTFSELELWTAKIAKILLKQGMKQGDHVLLLAPNVPEFTAVYYAILRLGGVVVPVNTLFLPNEITDLIDHSDAKLMIVWHALAEKGAAAFEKAETCKTLFFIGTERKNLPQNLFPEGQNRLVIDELIGDVSPEHIDYCQTAPDDTAVILYTSGTTGKSKGVELTHFNLYSNAWYVKEPPALHIQSDSVTLAVLPLFHTFGQTAIQNASIVAGAKIVMVPQFEPRRALAEIEKHSVTHIAAVPTMYNLMLQTQRRYNYNVSSLQVAISGGASLPVAIYHDFQEIFNVKINEGYGLSETSPIACLTPPFDGLNKPGSIGPEFYGTQVRIVRDDGTFADVEEVGELVIRGHNVMKGYYNDAGATAAVFLEGGWFRSGDMAKMDADGYVYIVDRAKDVIIRAGMNIYPREVEEVLHHHPAVLEAAVVGIPDKTLSENVIAFVVLAPGAEVSGQELQKYCRDRLAVYKCPKVVEFVEQLPKNSTGKIMKRALRDRK